MNFSVLPPEVSSTQMYSGAGSGPMLAAAASWDGLGGELSSAAESFSSVTSGVPWQGSAAAAMTAVATQYAQWLNAAGAQAGGAAAGAKAVAGIFEAAKAAIAHPMEVAANRVQLVSLVKLNLFGLNAPAIAATEGAYEQMWAQNVAALAGYHGAASAVAAQLAPWQQALQTLPGLASPAAASAAAPKPAASALSQALQVVAQLDEQALSNLASNNAAARSGAAMFLDAALSVASTDLSSGNILQAATDVTAGELVQAGVVGSVIYSDVVFLPGLVPFDLEVFGEELSM